MSHGQSFNIDLDELFGSDQTGNGAPSPVFGAAAFQPGVWNRVDASGPVDPVVLLGLDGGTSGCRMVASRPTPSGGFNNHNLSGDFRLLMADYGFIGQPMHYHFSGFQPGRYLVYTYGGNVQGTVRNLLVSVPGSSTSEQIITGPVDSNEFVEGLNYCRHTLDLTGNEFEMDVTTDNQFPAEIHGFQIVYSPVPEPGAGIVLVVAFGGYRLRRRKRPPPLPARPTDP